MPVPSFELTVIFNAIIIRVLSKLQNKGLDCVAYKMNGRYRIFGVHNYILENNNAQKL
jgi:hypothetical protein